MEVAKAPEKQLLRDAPELWRDRDEEDPLAQEAEALPN
jgi:hypothetical protein